MNRRRSLRKCKKYFELNKNEIISYQNLWDAAKVVFRGKCVALNAYITRENRLKINKLTL